MKKIVLLIICILGGTYWLQAQKIPPGMNYQAVARNLQGQMLQNKDIALKISLRADGPEGKIVYTEIHEVSTNDLGLFHLIIGQGQTSEKVGLPFVQVPWSDAEIWMEIGLDEQGGEDFEMLNVSKLMTVPYAFHAGTADKIKDQKFEDWYGELEEKRRGGSTGIPFWTVWGNSNVDTNYHWMGTSVAQDVIFKGNNIEAIRIKTDGSVNISGSSSFDDDLFVRRNLTVGQNTTLRGMLGVQGVTTLNDDLNVKKNTTLEGTLEVDLATTLKDDLTVEKNTALEGALDVDLATTLKDSLTVEKNTALEGTLQVDLATTLKDDLTVKKNTALEGTLEVDLATTLKDDLTVEKNTALEGTLEVDLATTLKDSLMVKKNTALEGTLEVDLATTLKDDLTVNKNTALKGTLDVDLATTLKDDLTVNKNTALKGTLDVDLATTLKDSLVVEGETILKDKLSITDNINGFVFSVENANADEATGGDGIQIKLGRTHPAWNGSTYQDVGNPAAQFFDDNLETAKGWFRGDGFEFTDVIGFFPIAFMAGATCSMVEELSAQLNSALELPLEVPETDILLELLREINGPDMTGQGDCDTPGDCLVPDELINEELADGAHFVGGQLVLPGFKLEFPDDFCPDFLPSLELPVLDFSDVNNSLTQQNQYLSFVDKDDRELGAIRAISIDEWLDDYFDGVWFVNMLGSAGKIDRLGAITGFVRQATEVADAFNTIGVEYTSGHGDYAEWLERLDPEEVISRGDIVAVIGGKITKQLEGAEQVMAVSQHPIVLGNMPSKEQVHLGSNVAFMGQIPVKVMGPVQSGDYIVANSAIPGYGIAVHPEDLKLEDTKFIVGRSWETKQSEGPAMINTVVGVHNGDYLKILQKFERQFEASEARFEALEAKIEILSEHLKQDSN